VKNRFQALTDMDNIENKWEALRTSMNKAAQETTSVTKKCEKKWMTTDILKLMYERRKAKGKETEYTRLCKEVKKRM